MIGPAFFLTHSNNEGGCVVQLSYISFVAYVVMSENSALYKFVCDREHLDNWPREDLDVQILPMSPVNIPQILKF